MTVIAIPSLSAKGWVDALGEKADLLLAHYFASDAYQSELYPNAVANAQVLFARYNNNLPGLKTAMRQSLEDYLGNYYQSATVDIADDRETNNSSRINLILYIEIVEERSKYIFSNLVSSVNGKFEKIARLNNTGTN